MIDYKKLGKRIAGRRKEMGIKQYELCDLIDVNYKYISNLETGRSAPSLETLMKLCDVLHTTPNYLLLGTISEDDSLSGDSIMKKIQSLSSDSREMVSSIIDVFAEKEK